MFSDPNPDLLRPVKSDEFLPAISLWTTLGGVLLMGSVGAAIILTAVTKYNITVKAPATVRPVGEVQIVQAATEGTVESIPVKENMAVKQGDAIAVIDSSQSLTKKSQLQGNIQQNQLQLRQILAQVTATDERIAAENWGMERAIASAEADLSRNQQEYRERKLTTVAEVEAAAANFQLAQLERQKAQEELQKEQAYLLKIAANLKATEASLKAANSKQNRYQPLRESGAISLDLLEETQRAVEQQEQAVAGEKAAFKVQQQAIESQRKTVEKQQQAVEVAAAKLKVVQAALNPSAAPVAIASERILQENAKGEAALAMLKKEREALIQSRHEIQNQINRDRQELQQIGIELKKTIITAPADGTILKLELRNSGQVVRPGESIARIAPSNASLVIKARVAAQDIGRVRVCKEEKVSDCTHGKAQLQVSAYPYPDYGTLKGAVRAIAPDAITVNSQDTSAATPYYEVTLQPEKLYLDKSGHQYPIQSGMEVTADIISTEETVLTFILTKARLLINL
jgi:HlyD family secretion protein